ncbi:CHASE4 domain-containing protein [Methanoregula sp.]|jgi:signal transduction histidine kinase|uniref:sensor histidine kinase n=1 Tax=Methanoregula sp. TaxID=2052170 RepID=UPI003C242963
MKVRTRTRLILVATLVIFLIILSFITQSLILQSFNVLEQKETTANVQKFVAQVNSQVENVAATCKDWSDRDETSAFITGTQGVNNPTAPFQPISMKNLGIDYILAYNSSGSLVFSEAISPDGTVDRSVPQELDGIIHDSIIPEGSPGGVAGRRGISYLNNDPIILAGYPIPSGNRMGSSAGTLVMGRLLTQDRIDNLDQILQMSATLVPYSRTANVQPLNADVENRLKKGAIIAQAMNDTRIEGTGMITGIENKPTFLLVRVDSTRPVYQEVEKSILIVATAIMVLSIVFLVVVQLLLQRFILAPLSTLDTGMKAIGKSGDLEQRIPERGDEEIVSLTRSLNQMLNEIQQQRDELRDLLDEIQQQRDDLSSARQELADRNNRLEELNRKANLYLDIYLDAISYEILNSLMGLRGYAELFRETAGPKEKYFIEKIIGVTQKSNEVIRNIETISHIYKTPPEIRPVNIGDILKKEIESRPDVHFRMDNCYRNVLANDMLGVVFDNLFSNSLKFGGTGVTIGISARDISDQDIEISVTDDGPGIPDVMKPRIFDRFAHDKKTRSSYGLGLHIVKMLIESYGGNVRADDRVAGDPKQGAAIRFTLRKA